MSTLSIIIVIIILHFVVGIGIVVYKIAKAPKRNKDSEDEFDDDYQ